MPASEPANPSGPAAELAAAELPPDFVAACRERFAGFVERGRTTAATEKGVLVLCHSDADGLAAGFVAVASGFFAVAAFLGGAPALGAAALAGAGAAVGFLPWNVRKKDSPRLFQGDVGALFSSFLLASLAVVAAGVRGRGAVPVWVGPMLLLPLLTDVLLTLADRARRRQPLFEAHREHFYQRWLTATGKPHAALAWRAWAIAATYGGAAVASMALGDLARLALFVAAVGFSTLAWRRLRRRL